MKKSILALVIIAASPVAIADSLIYGGASAGSSNFDGGSGSSYNVHLGTGILPFIGLEAGLTQSGDMDTANNESTEVKTLYVALKPSVDLGPLHLYAKAGLHSWEETVDNSVDDNLDSSDDGIDLMYGLGGEYSLGGPFTVGASYQTYVVDGKDMNTFSVSGTFHFM